MKKLLLILFGIAFIWQLATIERTVELGPGIMAPEPPLQTAVSTPHEFMAEEYTITPLAEFHIKAKVLAKKRYYFDRESDLSPVDLALGWEKMSNEGVLDRIDFSQSDRWYLWSVDEFPISRREIETQSANMHMIPANEEIRSLLKKVRKGQIIEIDGSLVKVTSRDGWSWISSLQRTDKGDGGCEVVWVEELRTIDL
jgi:hypothetical protein